MRYANHIGSGLPAALAAVVLLLCTPALHAQQMVTIGSADFNIVFDVPASWTATTDDDIKLSALTAISPDASMYMIVYAYKGTKTTTKQLLKDVVNDLGYPVSGDMGEEMINGLHAWVAELRGVKDGQHLGMFIMAATYNDNNYVAQIYTEEAKFEANAPLMNRILNSFKPAKK